MLGDVLCFAQEVLLVHCRLAPWHQLAILHATDSQVLVKVKVASPTKFRVLHWAKQILPRTAVARRSHVFVDWKILLHQYSLTTRACDGRAAAAGRFIASQLVVKYRRCCKTAVGCAPEAALLLHYASPDQSLLTRVGQAPPSLQTCKVTRTSRTYKSAPLNSE